MQPFTPEGFRRADRRRSPLDELVELNAPASLPVQAIAREANRLSVGQALDAGSAPFSAPVAPSGDGRLSDVQIAQIAARAGFSGEDLVTAVSVALAESGGDPTLTYSNTDKHKSQDLGLFQINNYWNRDWLNGSFGDPYDPYASARIAKSIVEQIGWKDWVTYKSGRYKNFDDRARAAIAGVM